MILHSACHLETNLESIFIVLYYFPFLTIYKCAVHLYSILYCTHSNYFVLWFYNYCKTGHLLPASVLWLNSQTSSVSIRGYCLSVFLSNSSHSTFFHCLLTWFITRSRIWMPVTKGSNKTWVRQR